MIYGLKDTPSYLWWYSKIKIHIPYVLFSKIEKNTFFLAIFWRFSQVSPPPRVFSQTFYRLSPKADIFRITHRITMIFSSKCRLKVIWQVLNTFRTIEYSTGPMRTHKETTNSTSKFGSKMAELEPPKIAHETKNWIFSKSEISIHQSNHGKRNIKSIIFCP